MEVPRSFEQYGLVFRGANHVASWYSTLEEAEEMAGLSPKRERPYVVRQTVTYSVAERVVSPRDIVCPTCDAKRGESCVALGVVVPWPHSARERAVQVRSDSADA